MYSNYCTGCGRQESSDFYQPHPLLDVPICGSCYQAYHLGEFIIENGNEIYCRWCGEGDGELCLCDSCPKSFCSGCIGRNFGNSELQRIVRLSNRWTCFLCSPQSLIDYCTRQNWILQHQHKNVLKDVDIQVDELNISTKTLKSKHSVGIITTKRQHIICDDISRGRENIEIPVVNEIDSTPAPLDFVYVTQYVPGKDVIITTNPEKLSCCTCVDNCSDSSKCTCLGIMQGPAYDQEGILVNDKSAMGIYECNSRCSCHIQSCHNRVVGKGPMLKLQVFRCPEIGKGWGVRCCTDIHPGTYIADYLGELIPEKAAEIRGLNASDEYLFNIDFFGCQHACSVLTDTGIKRGLDAVPREYDIDVSTLSISEAENILGTEFTSILIQSGAITRAQKLGENRLHSAENKVNNNYNETTKVKSISPIRPMVHSLSQFSSRNRSGVSSSELKNNTKSASTTSRKRSMSWYEINHRARLRAWRRARSILSDRVILSTESKYSLYTIDAKFYGSIGRFFNHSCEPNMDKLTVFTNDHDPRTVRVAFFASHFIPAYTELCYDYGYEQGSVDGKSRECLCGQPKCRKVWY